MLKVLISEAEDALGNVVPFQFSVPVESFSFDEDGLEFKGKVEITGTVTHTGTDYRVEGEILCRKSFVCDRCLVESEVEQRHVFSESFHRRGTNADSEEENVFSEDGIELDVLVRDTVVAAQPIRNLCSEDCRGLCPVCGVNRNVEECSCDTFVPDPRLAGLKDLWDAAQKEE